MQTKINKFKNIIKLITILFLLLLLLLSVNISKPLFAAPAGKLELYFFYSEDCQSCITELQNLNESIADKYKNVVIQTYEISKNKENLNLLFYILDKLGNKEIQKDLPVPVIIIEDRVLAGKSQIDNNLEIILNDSLNKAEYSNNVSNVIEDYFKGSQDNNIGENTFIAVPTIIVSALLDSINPCAIAVIIFLISTLLVSFDKKRILVYGLIYIITIFIIYLGLGFGLLYVIKKITIPHLLFIIIGSILILMGLINFKDFFAYGKGISLGIPGRFKEVIKKNIYKATIFSIILVGLVVSIFESACSGAIYLGVISLISQSGLNLKLLSLLLLYNFIFILPLLVILLIFYFGLPLKKINRFLIQKNKRIYRLITGIILVLLGVYLIVWI